MSVERQLVPGGHSTAEFDELLKRARNGCGTARGDLLQGCRRYLLLSANQSLDTTLRPKAGPSDVVQNTFLIAHRQFQDFEGNTLGELLSWLHRILERQLSDQVRHFKRTSKRSVRREVSTDGQSVAAARLVDEQPTPVDDFVQADEERRVRLAIERLPPDYQEVVRLRTWERLAFAEVGRLMQRSAGAAEKLWLRAVERLEIEIRDIP